MAIHNLCFNHFSLNPDLAPEEAYYLLFDAFQGAMALNQDQDLYVLHSDQDDLGECVVGDNYTFNDFTSELLQKGERDFFLFVSRMEDRSPFINFLEEEDIDELAKWTVYFPERAFEGPTDILIIAWLLQGFLLSLNTDKDWGSTYVKIDFSDDYSKPRESDSLRNIATRKHGDFYRNPELKDFLSICPDVHFSSGFADWEAGRRHEERALIRNKLEYACSNGFDFKRPLVDTIKNSRHSNLKELRIGGQIRIFFARLPDRSTAVLSGLFKYGKGRDYEEAICRADQVLDELLA